MSTSVHVRRPIGRLLLSVMLIVAMLPLSGLLSIDTALAAYTLRFSRTTNGAMTFTGNTLGLSKAPNVNTPGTADSIGTFITTNPALRETTYPLEPNGLGGTTASWPLNGSAASLNILAGSTILYAELIWSGSYSYGGENVSASLNNAVSFVTPSGQTFSVTPDPLTAKTLGTPAADGTCATDPSTSNLPPGQIVIPCFYVRSADVTAQVQAGGAGIYSTGGVPATQANVENSKNNAGWTLAVAYGSSSLPARNLALFIGDEVTNATNPRSPATITGFCTPINGTHAGRLMVSASEGDANRIGDGMQFGPDSLTLDNDPPAAPVYTLSGPNNRANNFFASQINGNAGTLDTSGTFGTRNETPSVAGAATVNLSGGRQGWDITNVDITNQLGFSQTSAVARGTSQGDQYVISALGTQIDVGAPAFPTNVKSVDKAQTFVGDRLTYTILVNNQGSADANNLLFKDPAPAGTSFVPGSFTVDGVVQPGADPAVGVNLGTVALNTLKTVKFQVQVNTLPVVAAIRFDNSASWTYTYVSCVGQPPLNGSLLTNQVSTTAPLLQPSKSVSPLGLVAVGTQLTYTITTPNNGTAGTIGATVTDAAPAGTTYVPGSTTLNGVAVADAAGGVMPFTTARLVNSPGAAAGVIAPGGTATVQFKVTVNAGAISAIVNVALFDPDGPGGVEPPVLVQAANPVVALTSTKAVAIVNDVAPIGGSPGDTVEYTVKTANVGGGTATGVKFNDAIPTNTTYVPGSTTLNGAPVADIGGTMPFASDQPINSPGAPAGQIPAGTTATITFRVTVNNPLPAGVTQVSNQGTVSSDQVTPKRTDDPKTPTPDDPTILPLTAAPVLSADKAVKLQVDADGNGVPSPGDTLRYTTTIINSGNSDATGVIFTDIPDANTTLVAGTLTTSQGTIVSGNTGTPPISINIGTIAGANGTVTITFDVRVKNPLPAGVRQVANQGTVDSKELPAVPTNDPRTPAPGDPTVTPIVAAPVLAAVKQATLFVDVNGDGLASPGDTILYVVTTSNTGNSDSTGNVYNDTPDTNTTLVPGSVQTSAGTIINGNAGAAPVTVNIGTIPGLGGNVTISYKVTINNPLPANVSQIINQGVVTSNELPPVPTKDVTPPGGTTIVPVVANPALASTKTSRLVIDADGNGLPSPGDTLVYNIVVRNTGNGGATDVVFADAPDSNSTLVVGSVQTSQGTVTNGNAAGNTSIAIAIGALPGGGASVSISFRVTINNPVPVGVTQLENQGIISGSNFPTILTDDPDTPQPNDPNITPLALTPLVDSTKTSSLFADVDGNGVVSPGDVLLYSVTMRNSGNAAATGVILNDIPDSNSTLVVGSVKTTQGTVTIGNTAGDLSVRVAVGTLPGGGSTLTISYQVTIKNPLPAGAVRIVNQANVGGDNIPTKPSSSPQSPGGPTVTTITATPQLGATKIARLFTDADNNGVPSPGDTLVYQITIQNTGNAAAIGTKFSDVLDQNVTLVVGSIQTSQGTVTNTPDITNSVGVDIGVIPGGGASVTISFRVTIHNPLDASVTQIVNQGVATGDNVPAVPTDNPDTPTPGDPNITPIISAPRLTADKAVSLFTDADKNSIASPGDTLQYQVIIQNSGNTAATGVTFTDTPDSNTTLVAGTLHTSQGTVAGGNAGAAPVVVNIGSIPVGAQVIISFQVTINNPLPPGVVQLVNQGTVTGAGIPPLLTNDPSTPPGGDPTITPIAAAPVLTADKTDILLIDANHSGSPSAGDTLLYIITIANTGNVAAPAVVFADTPDVDNTKLVVGTVQTSQGTVSKGNTAGDTSLQVEVGTLPAGASVTISFHAKLNDSLSRSLIINQGTVTSPSLPPLLTNDPETPAPGDPTDTIIPPGQITAVSLASFTATRSGDQIIVRWVTTAELNTWGFNLYRSADRNRANAVRVTPTLILGQGRGLGGAAYTWTDTDVQPGTTYNYWLQETELSGTVNEYGPATAANVSVLENSIFLPVVIH